MSFDNSRFTFNPWRDFAGVVMEQEDIRVRVWPAERAIEAALAACKGQVSGARGAAAKLGLPPQTLDSKIASLGIDKRRFKARAAGRRQA